VSRFMVAVVLSAVWSTLSLYLLAQHYALMSASR